MFYKWLNSIAVYRQFNWLVDFQVINQVIPEKLRTDGRIFKKRFFAIYSEKIHYW